MVLPFDQSRERVSMSVDAVLSGDARYNVTACRAEDLLDSLPDGCVSLIVTDPPYFKVKDDAWDRAWKKPDEFLGWIGGVFDKFRRVLAPNGSLYVFASPQMAWGVEGEVRKRFDVLNAITWSKPTGRSAGTCKEDLRGFFPDSERVIFAEQFGADSKALGASGYDAKCNELRGSVFEPLRASFDAERLRSGLTSAQIQDGMFARTGVRYTFDRHTFSRSQWEMPTPEQYAAAQDLFAASGEPAGAPYFPEAYESLRERFEELRVEYLRRREAHETLRRPFTVSAEVPYTDVWAYPTVQRYDGKHVCEKPWQMGLDIIRASSRPNDIVFDCFAGSGCFPAAAVALGRRAIACDMSEEWANATRERCARALESPEAAQSNRKASAPKRQRRQSEAPLFDLGKVA
ncbi:site-specific DNA-methyltransferase [Sorangium sp. So ce118]